MTSILIDDWRAEVAPVWERCLVHPFIQQLAAGALPLDQYQFYLLQTQRCRQRIGHLRQLLAEQMATPELAKAVRGLTGNQASITDSWLSAAGLTATEVKQVSLAPTALAYLNHLEVTAHEEGVAAGIAALTPGDWLSAWLFKQVKANYQSTKSLYQGMIDFYAGEQFQQAAFALVDALRQVAQEVDAPTRTKMRAAFVRSLDYQLLGLDMASGRQQWPHQRYPKLGR